MKLIPKPLPGEYDPYTIQYIKLLPDDGLILKHINNNGDAAVKFFLSLSDEQLWFRYAPGKWTIKDIVLHLSDDERIFTYRALRIARHDATALPGFDQDSYVVAGKANERSIQSLAEEFMTVRLSTISLFSSLPDDVWMRMGTANNHVVSVRALLYHLAGHELHHLNIIREKYLSPPTAK